MPNINCQCAYNFTCGYCLSNAKPQVFTPSKSINAPYTFKYRYKIYTGPTITHQIAQRLSRAYLNVFLVGTAHVYVKTNFGVDHILRILGATWKHSDIQLLD